MSLGGRIREERTRLGITQPQFGKVANASTRSVASWEADEAQPTAGALGHMAMAGVDVSYVLTGERGHATPKNLAQFENCALTSPIPSELFKGLRSLRSENVENLKHMLMMQDISLSDMAVANIINIVELYEIPIPQMAVMIGSIVSDLGNKS